MRIVVMWFDGKMRFKFFDFVLQADKFINEELHKSYNPRIYEEVT